MKFFERLKERLAEVKYRNLVLYKFSDEADKIVSAFLKRDFNVIMDNKYSRAYMFLVSGDLTLAVWTENRWYGFANQMTLSRNTKGFTPENPQYSLMLHGRTNCSERLFDRDQVSISRVNYERLKEIYLTCLPVIGSDFYKAMVEVQK